MSETSHCSGNCDSCKEKAKETDEDRSMKLTLRRIKHKIVVMSGKGGVGKSTVASNLAFALAMDGRSVGLLDADFHGPSIPKMLHLEDARPGSENDKMLPVEVGSLKVMSVGFLLRNPDDAVIWRGPMKIGVMKQMFSEVEWGDLDYLVVDCPPGTGDEPLSVCQMLSDGAALIVTTPQQVSAADVAKSLNFCSQLGYPVIGIVENMSGFICPKCGEVTEIFSSGAGEELAKKYGTRFLGKLPIDPRVCADGDSGRPFVHHSEGTPVAEAFRKVVANILETTDKK